MFLWNPDTAPPPWEGLPFPHQPPKSLWHTHLHYLPTAATRYRGTHGVTALPRAPPSHLWFSPRESRWSTSARRVFQLHPGFDCTGSQSSVSRPGPRAARPGSQRCSSASRHWMGLRNRLPAQLAQPGGRTASARCSGVPLCGCQAGGATAATTHAGCWAWHQVASIQAPRLLDTQ